jgi:PAS domain S-box-containing protein
MRPFYTSPTAGKPAANLPQQKLICDIATLGAGLLVTCFIAHTLVHHHPERLPIFWLMCVLALACVALSLKITLDAFSAYHLYGLLKAATTLLLWGDLLILLGLLRHTGHRKPDPGLGTTLEHETAKRVEAEEKQRLSENRFRTIFDNARDVITYVDSLGRIIDVNKRVEDVFGYKPDELIGKGFTQLGLVRARDIPKLFLLFCDTVIKGTATEIVELELKHKDGRSVFVEVGTRFIRQSGKVTEIVNVFRDITERRRARTGSGAATLLDQAIGWEPSPTTPGGADADSLVAIPEAPAESSATRYCLPVSHGIDVDLQADMNGANADRPSPIA